jgi:hypothetical protein
MMKLYAYTPAGEKDCLAIFDSNTPLYFATQERETFQRFLNRLAYPYVYYVVRDSNEKTVACGGIKFEPAKHSAWLRWDMVARGFHKQGIGTLLAISRMWLIGQISEIETVNLCTSQHTYQFYEKLGFVIQKIIPEGIAPGMDEYFMELKFDEGKRQELENFGKQESFAFSAQEGHQPPFIHLSAFTLHHL